MELADQATRKRELKAISKSDRSVDEVKNRYYQVAKAVLEGRGQKNHPIVQKPFSYEHEVRRKLNMEKIFLRTKDQHEKEKSYIQNLKFIDNKIKKIEKDEKNLKRLVDKNFEETRSQS